MRSEKMFTVHNISNDYLAELDSRVVGLAEDATDPSTRCLLFERTLTAPSDDERRLGLDSYAVSDEYGRTAYKALDFWELSARRLRLHFTAAGSASLGLPEEVDLELALSDEEVEQLRSGLRDVIGEQDASESLRDS